MSDESKETGKSENNEGVAKSSTLAVRASVT